MRLDPPASLPITSYWPAGTCGPVHVFAVTDEQSTWFQSNGADCDQLLARTMGLVTVSGHPVVTPGLDVQVRFPAESSTST
jgi:hypothetical protein